MNDDEFHAFTRPAPAVEDITPEQVRDLLDDRRAVEAVLAGLRTRQSGQPR